MTRFYRFIDKSLVYFTESNDLYPFHSGNFAYCLPKFLLEEKYKKVLPYIVANASIFLVSDWQAVSSSFAFKKFILFREYIDFLCDRYDIYENKSIEYKTRLFCILFKILSSHRFRINDINEEEKENIFMFLSKALYADESHKMILHDFYFFENIFADDFALMKKNFPLLYIGFKSIDSNNLRNFFMAFFDIMNKKSYKRIWFSLFRFPLKKWFMKISHGLHPTSLSGLFIFKKGDSRIIGNFLKEEKFFNIFLFCVVHNMISLQRDEKKWNSFLNWCFKNRDHEIFVTKNSNLLHDIIDYVSNVNDLEGFEQFHENMSMQTVLNNMEFYHLLVLKKESERYDEKESLPVAPLEDFEDNGFVVAQLKTAYNLLEESKQMHNCVKTYLERVRDNKSFIFKVSGPEKVDRATIEVLNDHGLHLVQARSFCNGTISDDTKNFLTDWCAKENITMNI